MLTEKNEVLMKAVLPAPKSKRGVGNLVNASENIFFRFLVPLRTERHRIGVDIATFWLAIMIIKGLVNKGSTGRAKFPTRLERLLFLLESYNLCLKVTSEKIALRNGKR